MQEIMPPKTNKIPRALLLKHLKWDNNEKRWISSDQRPQWATFTNADLFGLRKFQIRRSFTVQIDAMDIFHDEELKNITSKLLQKIEKCELDWITLRNQNISYYDYLFLTTSKVEELSLEFVKIKYDDGDVVPLDRILARCPKLRKFIVRGDYNDESMFNSETAKNLAELPRFKRLSLFELHDISDVFNVDDFCNFIRTHKFQNVDFDLHLFHSVSEDYSKNFHAVMNKMVEELKNEGRKTLKTLIKVNGREYPFQS